MSDKISEVLGLSPMPVAVAQTNPDIPTQYEGDFEYARGNMINIIEKGNEALDGILDLAGQSQQPRAYEVVTALIKTMSEVNKDLMDLTKKKKELQAMDGLGSNAKTINNNLFVGSTAELQKFLKDNGTAKE